MNIPRVRNNHLFWFQNSSRLQPFLGVRPFRLRGYVRGLSFWVCSLLSLCWHDGLWLSWWSVYWRCRSTVGTHFWWTVSLDCFYSYKISRFHEWPLGPTCVWPVDYTGNCSNVPATCECLDWQVTDGLYSIFVSCVFQTCVNEKCTPQCVEDSHCPDGYTCDDCGWCVPVGTTTPAATTTVAATTEDPGCQDTDAMCPGFDQLCHIPAHDNCFWCNGKLCEEGESGSML